MESPLSGRAESLYGRLVESGTPASLARPALMTADDALSHGELLGLVDAVARSLSAAGAGEGDRVALVAPNSPEYVVAFLAITAVGGVAVPVDVGAGPERLRFILEDTAPKLCVHAAEIDLSEAAPGLAAADARLSIEVDMAGKSLRTVPGTVAAPGSPPASGEQRAGPSHPRNPSFASAPSLPSPSPA